MAEKIHEVEGMKQIFLAAVGRSPGSGSSLRRLRGIGRTCLGLTIVISLVAIAYAATAGQFEALTPYQRSVMLLISITFLAIVTFNLAVWRYVRRARIDPGPGRRGAQRHL